MSDSFRWFFCAEKQRVYQGVRVKTTVKELLQRHRAKEASRKPQPVYLEQKELYPSVPQNRHEDPPPAAPQADMSSRALQLRAPCLPVTKSSCSLHMQASAFCDTQQQQFGDLMLPSNDYSFSSRGAMDYNSLPPLPTSSPLPWSHAISSDVDYYGQGMAACSSSESLTLYTPLDPNSYSPQDSFSSSSSSCYDSPTRMESSFHGSLSKRYPYQYCNPHQDNVAECWPAQLESTPLDEYAPYHLPTDYPYIQPVEESYFRKDFPLGSEMCYNIL
ncbi:colorectal cancer-associated protein 2 isoform X1 [Xiphophorus maculatus]|uniref:colorectal cancer-associated protein 2 isoform X1 n=1 Tax=Xiphophorus maculatus TaxID=8083 RepID=UPI000C6C97B1|nr:colorectal cancer-associated protein 2 isoform X1 [Xiphophorus maculatus]